METLRKFLQDKFEILVNEIDRFEIIDKQLLPYGLKPHTRSVAWILEQVITQNTKVYKDLLDINEVEEPLSDLEVWDYKINFNELDEDLYVNIKVTEFTRPRRKNDMSSIKKILAFFSENPHAHLLYAVFPFKFKGTEIIFTRFPDTYRSSSKVITGFYSRMDDFVLNKRNEHLQAFYDVRQVDRDNQEFNELIKDKAKQKGILLGL